MSLLVHFIAQACTPPTNINNPALVGGTCLPQAAASPANLRKIFFIIFTIIGALSFLFMVIAGFRYILARGNMEAITKAKSQIQYSLIGLVLAGMAAVI